MPGLHTVDFYCSVAALNVKFQSFRSVKVFFWSFLGVKVAIWQNILEFTVVIHEGVQSFDTLLNLHGKGQLIIVSINL